MPGESAGYGDARSRLVREKYFCVRPRPLERWLWSQRITSSAERVFWLHWQEGMQRGDWCSEIPLSRVARECCLDVSTVTRAYQLLTRLGCLRRTDQGRDPANPFQQATALTEIRIPHELFVQLERHPNRRRCSEAAAEKSKEGGAATRAELEVLEQGKVDQCEGPALKDVAQSTRSVVPNRSDSAIKVSTLSTPVGLKSGLASIVGPNEPGSYAAADPFPGLRGRERSGALARLIEPMSLAERHAYQEALRMHLQQMAFDTDSRLSKEAQSQILRLLTSMALASKAVDSKSEVCGGKVHSHTPPKLQGPRKLGAFELSRLSRDLQSAASITAAPELMRQVVWSIETGALRRFDTRHALHIALKKIREGRWTRPHRMPPNWVRVLSDASALETCGHA